MIYTQHSHKGVPYAVLEEHGGYTVSTPWYSYNVFIRKDSSGRYRESFYLNKRLEFDTLDQLVGEALKGLYGDRVLKGLLDQREIDFRGYLEVRELKDFCIDNCYPDEIPEIDLVINERKNRLLKTLEIITALRALQKENQ